MFVLTQLTSNPEHGSEYTAVLAVSKEEDRLVRYLAEEVLGAPLENVRWMLKNHLSASGSGLTKDLEADPQNVDFFICSVEEI